MATRHYFRQTLYYNPDSILFVASGKCYTIFEIGLKLAKITGKQFTTNIVFAKINEALPLVTRAKAHMR